MEQERLSELRKWFIDTFKEHAESGDAYVFFTAPDPKSDKPFLSSAEIEGGFLNSAFSEDGVTMGLVGWHPEDIEQAQKAADDYSAQTNRFSCVEGPIVLEK